MHRMLIKKLNLIIIIIIIINLRIISKKKKLLLKSCAYYKRVYNCMYSEYIFKKRDVAECLFFLNRTLQSVLATKDFFFFFSSPPFSSLPFYLSRVLLFQKFTFWMKKKIGQRVPDCVIISLSRFQFLVDDNCNEYYAEARILFQRHFLFFFLSIINQNWIFLFRLQWTN